ncbi:MAG: DUF5977 domain-containing protein [Chitinophagaceae bacterium]
MKPGFQILGLVLFVFTMTGNLYSQSEAVDYKQQLKMPEVLPPSPEAAGIEKFGNIPVSYATGVPDISIPLWNIKCGNLSWPVSLAYHAGGIRVDEIASSAGLGWSVNTAGVISRSVVGRPDEENNPEPVYTAVTSNDYQYLYQVLDGIADSEQDIFSFNFNGKSGKFVINQDGSIFQIPQSNLKITYASLLSSFTITDENGITYLFDQTELTTSHNIATDATDILYNSAWYLKKVEMPDKNNTILFSYAYAGTSGQLFKNFHHAIGAKYNSGTPLPEPLNASSTSGVNLIADMLKLTEITFPNGSITLTYDPSVRLDIGSAYNKLSEIKINWMAGGVYIQSKKFRLYQSYFYNNPDPGNLYTTNPILYRLRLDSLSESGLSSDPFPKKYKFQYNTTPMVPRGNYGQDIWGYNNGQWANPTLLQSQAVFFNNGYSSSTYNIGNANRNVDENQMKACMLSSIIYPTGGKTVFTFEPNEYDAEQNLSSPAEQETHVSGSQVAPQVSTTTFIFPSTATAEYPRVIVNMSKFDFSGVYQPSWVSLKDLTTGVQIYMQSQTTPGQSVSMDEGIWLEQGHNYELKAYVYTNISNPQLTASIKVKWNNKVNQPDIRKGGGLRIKEIKNYTDNGILAGTETYVYDTAVTLTPFYHIKRTYSEVFYRLGLHTSASPFNCVYYVSPLCRIYTSASVYPLSTAMGSPMLYRRVQKITTDASTGSVNGKSEYMFDVFRDETFPIGGRNIIPPLISNDWKNGFLSVETQLKFSNGSYSIIKKTENKYSEYNSTQTYSLKVQGNYIHEGCKILGSDRIGNDATYTTYPIRSGSKRLYQKITTLYDDNQNKIETVSANYYMSNKYDFPTTNIIVDSRGIQDSITFKYSPDFSSAGNVYEKMVQRNIIAPVIQQKSYNGATLLNTIKINYRDWNSDGKIIAPDSIQASVLNNAPETRLKYYSYDAYNNPLSVSKNKDVKTSYLWAYNNSYPVAEVSNADINSVAYTSFESSETGGWSGITIPGFAVNGSMTGQKSYTQAGFSISKNGLSSSAIYMVTYWSKNGSYAVNATSTTALKTANGWTLYEHRVVNPPGGIITVSGSGTIDELRLYPDVAQMKTYTYEPLKGISSESDVNNRIISYYYDGLARLILAKDENNNILKQICYNYAGQPENCNLYGNAAQSGTFQKSCTSGSGSFVLYTVPANTYYAASLIEANNLAVADRDTKGQSYANAYGTCTPTQITVTIQSSVSIAYTISFYNTSTSQTYNLNLNPSGSTTTSIPAGTYNVTISPTSMPSSVNFLVNGYSFYGTGNTFYGVYMGTGSSVQISY